MLSIVNDYANEDDHTLAEEERDLLAVRANCNERHNSESAEDFLLK